MNNWKKRHIKYLIKQANSDNNTILNYAKYNIDFVEYIDKERFKDDKFLKKLLNLNGLALQYLPQELRNNKEIVIIALKHSDGFALKYASKELQDEFNKIIDDYYKKHKV